MGSSKFFRGTPILLGDNTIPGVRIPKELSVLIPKIYKACEDFGLDTYPAIIQMLTYAEISEIAAFGGFPVRFPHWTFGMEYEELQRGYEHGMHRIFEMVINTNPCYIYCLDSNTLVDNVTVIAHAMGHNHFFKNNIYFSQTTQNMMNTLANNGTRIRRYMNRWGKETVTEFIDHVLRIQTLVDPAVAWHQKVVKDPIIQDSRKYRFPIRLRVQEGHDYMESYLNPKSWLDRQQEDIKRKDAEEQLGIFTDSTKDIMGFIRDQANLKPWQQDIMSMLHDEALYFYPQGDTKTINEGFASWTDSNIMARMGLVGLGQKTPDAGIVEYALHKTAVLGGKYSTNPYKVGYMLLCDIEKRWNEGRFGQEYDDCKDIKQREHWDKKLGQGKEKVFQVCRDYNDLMLIIEFFTEDFCHENEFYEWKRYPTGEYKIESRDYKKIRDKLIKRYLNRGLPEIQLVDPNHRGKGHMLLEHTWDNRGTLLESFLKATMESLYFLWGNTIVLNSKNDDEEAIVYVCHGTSDKDFEKLTEAEYKELL